jgi:hypothetical protein
MAGDKGLALLLGTQPEDDDDGDEVLLGVAEDLIEAVKTRDAAAVASALRAAHEHCAAGDYADDEMDEEE